GKDISAKDTLARAQFMSGNVEAAIATERAALTLTDDPRAKAQLNKALEEFQAAAPPR
ncbi:MAG: hypothetical protein IT580_23575, partial [Verrucomicrobiales bacterium]|nr:hypothetical protein [Verrucomicrobiales bacterium]